MTLQINLKQIRADGASNSEVLAWSNSSNSWVAADASTLLSVPDANSSVSGILKVVDSTTNTSITVAASANSVKTAYDAAIVAQSLAATAYSNSVAVASTDATNKAATAYANASAHADIVAATAYANAYYWANVFSTTAYANAAAMATTAQNMAIAANTTATNLSATAYSNATNYADTRAAVAYSNAITYAASNTYVNTELGYKASLSGATFTGEVSVTNSISVGNTTITGFANVTSSLQVGGTLTVAGNLVINGTTTTVNTSSINVTDSLLYLASNNEVSDTLDIGFAAHYNNGSGANGHTGFFRSAVTKKYYLFQNYQPEFFANNTVDVANTATGIQMADLVVGNLVANSTLTVTGATTLNSTLAAGNTTVTGSLLANTGLLSANTIQFNDGSQQSTYIDPIAMAIALG